MVPNQVILIGGGASLKPYLPKLKEKLKGKFVIGLNFSHEFIDSTFSCFVDKTFYKNNSNKLKNLPLIVGKKHSGLKIVHPYYHNKRITKLDNTILLPATNTYDRSLKSGVFKSSLVGVFSLSIAIYLIENGVCYLLGYDYGSLDKKKRVNNKIETHFYQDKLNHRGIGKVNFYTKSKQEKLFGCFKKLKGIEVINVSPQSNLEVFPKMDYDTFFKRLDKRTYNQEELRKEIREKLKKI